MTDRQMALDFGHKPALGSEDFLVAPCNAEAFAWLGNQPNWPSHALALYGPEGCGKTHLLALFSHHVEGGIKIVAASQLNSEGALHMQLGGGLAVDDLDDLVDETALFHLWNRCKDAKAPLVMAGRLAPARMNIALPDLRSRLSATPAIGIDMPDDSLLAAVLVKLFADRQLRVGEGVVTYILGRAPRSFAAIGRLVGKLDVASLAEHRAVSIRLARRILEEHIAQDDRQGELAWN